MKQKKAILGIMGAALMAMGAGATGAVISQSATPTQQNESNKQQGIVTNPQLSRARRYKSNMLPGIDPLQHETVLFRAYTSPIWYGKSQRTKHFNKKRHGRMLRRKHKKS